MTPKEIKSALKAKGYSSAMIADVLGKSVASVSGVVNGNSISYPIAEAVSKAIGKSVQEVFPNVESYRQPKAQLREQKTQELTQLLRA